MKRSVCEVRIRRMRQAPPDDSSAGSIISASVTRNANVTHRINSKGFAGRCAQNTKTTAVNPRVGGSNKTEPARGERSAQPSALNRTHPREPPNRTNAWITSCKLLKSTTPRGGDATRLRQITPKRLQLSYEQALGIPDGLWTLHESWQMGGPQIIGAQLEANRGSQ